MMVREFAWDQPFAACMVHVYDIRERLPITDDADRERVRGRFYPKRYHACDPAKSITDMESRLYSRCTTMHGVMLFDFLNIIPKTRPIAMTPTTSSMEP